MFVQNCSYFSLINSTRGSAVALHNNTYCKDDDNLYLLIAIWKDEMKSSKLRFLEKNRMSWWSLLS